MAFAGINYLGVAIAAVAAFAFGAAYYMILSKPWLAAVGIEGEVKPKPANFAISFVCELVMAWMLAGVVGHLGEVTVTASVISAAFLWFGFVITTMIVNHRYGGAKWALTAIDGAHWLGVLLVMGAVIGWIGV